VHPELGEPWAVQKLYAPVFSVARVTSLHKAALEAMGESPFAEWIERLDPDADVGKRMTSVEVSATLGRGRDALRAHRTQVDPDGNWFRMSEDLVVQSYPYEDFELLASRLTIEPDEKSLFDGIAVG